MIKCWFDGACEPNNARGIMAAATVIFREDALLHQEGKLLPETICDGHRSNNIAEYVGFIMTLGELIARGLQDEEIVIHGDSKMVINQMFHGWKMRRGMYLPMASKALFMRDGFKALTGLWVPREANELADALCRSALLLKHPLTN